MEKKITFSNNAGIVTITGGMISNFTFYDGHPNPIGTQATLRAFVLYVEAAIKLRDIVLAEVEKNINESTTTT